MAKGEIWVGTTNGLIQLTKDNGATWQSVTPPGLTQFTMISIIEASHFDAGTAYVAVDRHEENDFKPHIYRTHDSGKTWEQVSGGHPRWRFCARGARRSGAQGACCTQERRTRRMCRSTMANTGVRCS